MICHMKKIDAKELDMILLNNSYIPSRIRADAFEWFLHVQGIGWFFFDKWWFYLFCERKREQLGSRFSSSVRSEWEIRIYVQTNRSAILIFGIFITFIDHSFNVVSLGHSQSKLTLKIHESYGWLFFTTPQLT